MNGLQGRVLQLPAPKSHNHEILLIYGHHAMIERWWGLAQTLNRYGAVTMPDLPGFGGMDSFHKIGKKPTIDNYADYLAAFIKMHYKRRRVTIMGISFGFVVATRMLQKYPELAKRVDFAVSIVGFAHRDDFLFTKRQRLGYRLGAKAIAARPVAFFVRHAILNAFFIKYIYVHWGRAKRRFADTPSDVFKEMLDFEVKLWQLNDVHTHWATTAEFLNLDNCKTRVELPVWHVWSRHDHYFDNTIVEQHMSVVFSEYHQAVADLKAHTPSVVGDRKAMSVLVPPALRRALSKQ
jgi:pimeloyl-ACP methyl ester carboxylesterase